MTNYIDEFENGRYYNKAEKQQLFEYLKFIELRAKGEIMTGAQWLRKFVMNSKLYAKDSIISDALCREITNVVDDIVHGRKNVPELVGKDVNIAQRRKEKIKIAIPKKSEMEALSTKLKLGLLQSETGSMMPKLEAFQSKSEVKYNDGSELKLSSSRSSGLERQYLSSASLNNSYCESSASATYSSNVFDLEIGRKSNEALVVAESSEPSSHKAVILEEKNSNSNSCWRFFLGCFAKRRV